MRHRSKRPGNHRGHDRGRFDRSKSRPRENRDRSKPANDPKTKTTGIVKPNNSVPPCNTHIRYDLNASPSLSNHVFEDVPGQQYDRLKYPKEMGENGEQSDANTLDLSSDTGNNNEDPLMNVIIPNSYIGETSTTPMTGGDKEVECVPTSPSSSVAISSSNNAGIMKTADHEVQKDKGREEAQSTHQHQKFEHQQQQTYENQVEAEKTKMPKGGNIKRGNNLGKWNHTKAKSPKRKNGKK